MAPDDNDFDRRQILGLGAGAVTLVSLATTAGAQPAEPVNVVLQFFALCISETDEAGDFQELLATSPDDPNYDARFQEAMEIAGIWDMVPSQQLQYIKDEVRDMARAPVNINIAPFNLTGWERCQRLAKALGGQNPNGVFTV